MVQGTGPYNRLDDAERCQGLRNRVGDAQRMHMHRTTSEWQLMSGRSASTRPSHFRVFFADSTITDDGDGPVCSAFIFYKYPSEQGICRVDLAPSLLSRRSIVRPGVGCVRTCMKPLKPGPTMRRRRCYSSSAMSVPRPARSSPCP